MENTDIGQKQKNKQIKENVLGNNSMVANKENVTNNKKTNSNIRLLE